MSRMSAHGRFTARPEVSYRAASAPTQIEFATTVCSASLRNRGDSIHSTMQLRQVDSSAEAVHFCYPTESQIPPELLQ